MKLFYMLLLLFLPFFYSHAVELTFDEAKKILLEKNSVIKSYKEGMASSKFRLNQARGNYLPKINFTETFVSTDEPGAAAFAKMAQGRFDNIYMAKMADPNRVNNFETKIEVLQPILQNGKIFFGARQAEEIYNASRYTLESVKQDLIYNLVKVYYGKMLAEKSVEVAKNSLNRTKRYRDLSEDFYKNGMIVKSDLLVSESYVNLSESAVAEANKQVETITSYLQRLLDIDEPVKIVWSDIKLSMDKNLDEYIDIALKYRNDLKVMENYLKVYDFENKKSKMNFIPEVLAFANYKMSDSSIAGDSGKGLTVGAMLNLNLFSGLTDYNKISETKSSYMAYAYKIMDKKNEIKTEVKDAYYSVIAAEKKVEFHKKALEAAYAALKITEERFKEGLSRITDLLDREYDVKNAELGLYMAEYEMVESKARLYKAAGLLN